MPPARPDYVISCLQVTERELHNRAVAERLGVPVLGVPLADRGLVRHDSAGRKGTRCVVREQQTIRAGYQQRHSCLVARFWGDTAVDEASPRIEIALR